MVYPLARNGRLGLAVGTRGLAQADPLPSWNEGPAKKAIIAFVQLTMKDLEKILAATLTGMSVRGRALTSQDDQNA